MKRITLKEKGITLIALVVTIIVLLILAGVTISIALNNNGIISRTKDTKEENRGAIVQEQRDLWMADKKLSSYFEDNGEALNDLLERLGPNGENLLTNDEIETIKDTSQIKIGSRTIDFKILNLDNSNEVLEYINYTTSNNLDLDPNILVYIDGNYPILRCRYSDGKLYRVDATYDEENYTYTVNGVTLEPEQLDATISVVNGKKQIQTCFGTYTEEIDDWSIWCNSPKDGSEFYHNVEEGSYMISRENDPNGWYLWSYDESGKLIAIFND